jgi:hypothetical protein
MNVKTYQVTIEGKNSLLMHWDNIEWADDMDAWRANPANKKHSRAGDDRTPAWRWVGNVYHDGRTVGMPSDNIMRCLMEGGAMVPVPGAKGNKTFKAQTQSGLGLPDTHWPIITPQGLIEWPRVDAARKLDDFAANKALAESLGFKLFVKRAKVGTTKHIRVRPRFDVWSLQGLIHVWDEQITKDVLQDILTYAGQYKGLGDWRPSGKTPGSFGMFAATVKAV